MLDPPCQFVARIPGSFDPFADLPGFFRVSLVDDRHGFRRHGGRDGGFSGGAATLSALTVELRLMTTNRTIIAPMVHNKRSRNGASDIPDCPCAGRFMRRALVSF
ncbi:MAG: hypothetical protein QM811_09505 [Pirellulales bacterium]